MKTDYSIRPNRESETDAYPKAVRAAIAKLDDAEQSFFRANPDELEKCEPVTRAKLVDKVGRRVYELRMDLLTWASVQSHIRVEFNLDVSNATLRRWCQRAVTP